jgi:hypothetical protein
VVLPGRTAVSVVDIAVEEIAPVSGRGRGSEPAHVSALGLAAAYGDVRVTVHPHAPER